MTISLTTSLVSYNCCNSNITEKTGKALIGIDIVLAIVALAILLKCKKFQSVDPKSVAIITQSAKIWFIVEAILLGIFSLLSCGLFILNRYKNNS